MSMLCFVGIHKYDYDFIYLARTQKNKKKKYLTVAICKRCGKELYTNKPYESTSKS